MENKIILIDANDPQYNVKNKDGKEVPFGSLSFYSSTDGMQLIDDIFDQIEQNNLILLRLGESYYHLLKYVKLASCRSCYFTGIIDNYFNLLEQYPNKKQYQTDQEYQDECNQFIFKNYKFGKRDIIFLKDTEAEPNVFYSFINNYNIS